MEIFQTPTFKKQTKKLHKNQKRDLDKVIKKTVNDPLVGNIKKGDFNGVRVYKFKMAKQLMLLGYEFYENDMVLVMLSLGSHENFYKDLKK